MGEAGKAEVQYLRDRPAGMDDRDGAPEGVSAGRSEDGAVFIRGTGKRLTMRLGSSLSAPGNG